jgi:hypothetical protein
MVKKSKEDRRYWVRAKRVLSIQHRLHKGKRNSIVKTWGVSTTQDMSMGGLSFYTGREYREGDILELSVVMSGVLDIFKGFGRVVRVNRKKTGSYFFVAVQFVEQKAKRRRAKAYKPKKRNRLKSVKKI